MKSIVFRPSLLKAHVSAYTRKDGAYVAAHDDRRLSADQKLHAGRIAAVKALANDHTIEYRRSSRKKTGFFHREGAIFHEHSVFAPEGMEAPESRDDAIRALLKIHEDEYDKATDRQEHQQARRNAVAEMKAVYEKYSHVINSAHENKEMTFQFLPLAEFNARGNGSLHIYKSPVRHGRQSSEYRLVMVNGEPAYARKSNHWGAFTTNIKAGSEDAKRMGFKDDDADHFGRVGFKLHKWHLEGASKQTGSRAGYILLKDLIRLHADRKGIVFVKSRVVCKSAELLRAQVVTPQ